MANTIKQITTDKGEKHNLGNIEIAAVKAVEQGTNTFNNAGTFSAGLSSGGGVTLTDGQQLAGSKQEVVAGNPGQLTVAQSGALVSLSGGARTVILPPVATAGVNFNIVAGSTHNHILSASADETKLQGVVLDRGNGTTVAAAGIVDARGITLGNGLIGDSISCVSDGTNWHLVAVLKDTPTVG